MTTVAALSLLFAVGTLCVAHFHATRARNLELVVCCLADCLTDRHAQLDDARRNCGHWLARTDALLAENSTLLVDLMHTEQQLQFYRAHYRQWRDVSAGVIMLGWMARGGEAIREGQVP